MTKTQEKERETSAEWSRLHDELIAVIRKEFTVGTKIKWMHGINWIYGSVVEANDDWSTTVIVQNEKSKSKVQKEAKHLDFDDRK